MDCLFYLKYSKSFLKKLNFPYFSFKFGLKSFLTLS